MGLECGFVGLIRCECTDCYDRLAIPHMLHIHPVELPQPYSFQYPITCRTVVPFDTRAGFFSHTSETGFSFRCRPVHLIPQEPGTGEQQPIKASLNHRLGGRNVGAGSELSPCRNYRSQPDSHWFDPGSDRVQRPRPVRHRGTPEGRTFVGFSRHADDHAGMTLGGLVNGKLVPYPSADVSLPSELSDAKRLVSVHGMTLDKCGRL